MVGLGRWGPLRPIPTRTGAAGPASPPRSHPGTPRFAVLKWCARADPRVKVARASHSEPVLRRCPRGAPEAWGARAAPSAKPPSMSFGRRLRSRVRLLQGDGAGTCAEPCSRMVAPPTPETRRCPRAGEWAGRHTAMGMSLGCAPESARTQTRAAGAWPSFRERSRRGAFTGRESRGGLGRGGRRWDGGEAGRSVSGTQRLNWVCVDGHTVGQSLKPSHCARELVPCHHTGNGPQERALGPGWGGSAD